MTEHGWPFLIGRAEHAGYRVVVVPDFMADAAAVDALSGAARDVRLPADTACVRELRGLECGPVTVVYRCFNPRADDYGLGGDELSDGFGRPIRVTEGVALRSAATGGLPEITIADLDRAHAAVAGAYRDFWQHERDYVRRTSAGRPLGNSAGSGEQPVHLEVAEPWSRPRAATAARGPAARQPAEHRRRPRRTAPAVAVTAAVLIAGLVVGVPLVSGALRGKPAPAAASVLGGFCDALKAGRPDAAYGYTSPQLRSMISPTDFVRELLPTAPRATECAYTVKVASGSAARGTVVLTAGSAPPTTWNVTLAAGGGASWLIDSLMPTG